MAPKDSAYQVFQSGGGIYVEWLQRTLLTKCSRMVEVSRVAPKDSAYQVFQSGGGV